MFKYIKLKLHLYKSKIDYILSEIKNKGLISILFKKRYLKIDDLYNKYIDLKNYNNKDYISSLLNSSGIKLFIDKLLLKKVIINNLYKGYEPLIIIENLYNKYPYVFNNSYIATLYLETKGRIFYYLPKHIKNNEELIMKIIKKEDKYKRTNYSMFLLYKKTTLSLYDILDKNFCIKKDRNHFIIKKFYPKYIFLLSGLVRKKELEIYFKQEMTISEEILERIHTKIIFEESKLFLATKLFEHNKINKNIIKKYLEREYIDNYYILENLHNLLGLNYININLENLNIYNKDEIKNIVKMYPNLSLCENENYRNKDKFNEMLENIITEYTTYSNNKNQLKWNLTNEELMEIKHFIKQNVIGRYVNFEYILNEKVMSNLIKIDADFFCDYYFKNKYSKEMLSNFKDSPSSQYIDLTIDNDMDKNLILRNAYINDLERMEEKIINYLINIKDENFILVCRDFLQNKDISNLRKEKILKKCPKLSSFVNLSIIFSKVELKNLIEENSKIYKYCDISTKENTEYALSILNKNINNLKYIPKSFFYSKSFLNEVLKIDKRCLDTILKIMSGLKYSKYEDIEDFILNEYLRSENDKYLKYLSEEIIETYIILEKINANNIIDKKASKKVKKIYENLKEAKVI